ncbi:hypothetical protein BDP81DRAFT_416489 [Colletotrichum phormii]|uniref:Uncharacterized protein n=1 Tax=Colletotrichum phormii TaxID=359342 RepID=A0AAJ0A1L7_9PEZI|nr:uncharacterized protein BDP81DRAFT_416489 [Colletotrichum phormii]KAK1654789.1 hypothetical protein BDP81DRAFT_416489 [Colletotrichum phormii]
MPQWRKRKETPREREDGGLSTPVLIRGTDTRIITPSIPRPNLGKNGNSRKLYVGYPCSSSFSPTGFVFAAAAAGRKRVRTDRDGIPTSDKHTHHTTPHYLVRIMGMTYYGYSVLQLLSPSYK